MYYYAYIDENNICTGTYNFPTQVTLDNYIYIGETDNPDLVGMYYNETTGEWEEPSYIYAYLDTDDVCISVQQYTSEMSGTRYIRLETLDQSLVGLWYDRTDGTFKAVPIHVSAEHSSSEINYKDQDVWLDDILDAKANATDVYTKTEVDTLLGNVEGGTGTAGADGEDGATFTPSVSAEGVISWTNDKGLTNPTPVNIKGADGEDGTDGVSPTVTISKTGTVTTITIVDATGTHTATINDGESGADITAAQVIEKLLTVDGSGSGLDADKLDGNDSSYFATATQLADKASAEHSHTMSEVTGLTTALAGKSDTTHTHSGYATSDHTHSGYASSSHTHTGYASSSHTHSDYLSTSGGTVTGETNFSGGLVRLKGTQTLYHSGSMITLSSNSLPTQIAGSAIYSSKSISVSSDERLKENIADVDAQACIDFINAIDVKTFNYKNDETPCVGVIAQQLKALSPELAKRLVTEDKDGMLGVKTSDLVFPLIVAVQALLNK